MSGTSNVGNRGVYEAGDQRNPPQSEIDDRQRFKEGQPNSHKANDSKDERTIANKLEREAQREKEGEEESEEARLSKVDARLPALANGNEPSKGAKIDQELRDEDAKILAGMGTFGPK